MQISCGNKWQCLSNLTGLDLCFGPKKSSGTYKSKIEIMQKVFAKVNFWFKLIIIQKIVRVLFSFGNFQTNTIHQVLSQLFDTVSLVTKWQFVYNFCKCNRHKKLKSSMNVTRMQKWARPWVKQRCWKFAKMFKLQV